MAGCTGFIYDQDTGPIAIRVEVIDSPNSKLQLSQITDNGSYVVSSLVKYTVAGGTKVKIPQQAREDAGYVPPSGGAIAGIAASNSTAGSGFVTFANSNGITFGLSNNIMTASGGGGGVAIEAGANSRSSGTVVFSNSNGVGFGMDTNGILTASYTVPTVPAQTSLVYSNSNNVSFGQAGSTLTASASFPAQTQFVLSASNGLAFGTNGSTVTGSYTVPGATVFSNSNNVSFGLNGSTVTASASFNQTSSSVVFSNSNNVSFTLNGSTLNASASFPAQSNQPVAASASNGSFNFSTLGFVQGSGVTWATQAGGIQASVKTDYQSSNANYLTSQSNQALSGSNGSFNFQTASFGASNGATFYTTNGSMVVSYTVPSVPAQTVQPVAASGSNGSFLFSTLSMGNSNGLTFYTTNGSMVGSYTVPTIPGATVFSNSNNVSFGLNGSTITATASFPGGGLTSGAGFLQGNTTGQSSSSTYALTSLNVSGAGNVSVGWSNSTLIISATGGAGNATVFSNSNNVSFGLNGSTVTATATFPAQTVQPVAASASNGSFNFSTLGFVQGSGVTWATQAGGIQASVKTDYQSSNANYLTSQSNQALSGSNGSFAFQTATFGNSNGATFYTTNGSMVLSYTVPAAQTVQPVAASASNGSFNFSTLGFVQGSGVTWATQAGGIQASVKTDYQSSNANYLTSQSNQALSGSNGSFAFQTASFGNSNGLTFYTTNGSMVASYTVPTVTNSTAPAAIAVAGSTITAGTVVFSNSNGVSFGANGNTITVTVQPGAAAGLAAASAGTQQATSGTLQFVNSNNVSFGMTNSSQITASVTFAQSTQPVAVSGSNGSFAFSTLTMGASNGLTFYTTNGSVVGSYTVPTVPGATVFSNSNNVSFGLNGSTVTATATWPAQTVQPVAASASNGSFNFSTLGFVQGSGVTWATQAGGIQASVKTDYQSSNANYLTSQSNQAFSASGGSSAFQTLNFANSNGVTFTNTGGSVAISYTVPGATVFSNSNNVSFGLNGSTVTATATFPAQTAQPVAASASNGSFNFSTLRFSEGGGVTWSTNTNGINASVKTDYQSSNANYLTSQSNQALSGSNGSFTFQTATFGSSNGMHFYTTNGSIVGSYTVPTIPGATVFSNSNNVSFGLNGSTVTATATFAQTNQTLGVYATGASSFGQSSSSTYDARSFSIIGSGAVSVGQSGGSIIISGGAGAGQTTGGGYLQGNTTGQSSSSTYALSSFNVSGAGNVSVGWSNSTMIISATGGGGGGAAVGISTAGNTQGTSGFYSNGTYIFEGSNGISLSQLTAATPGVQTLRLVAPPTSQLAAGNSITITSNGSTISIVGPVFSNSNNVSFGMNAGTVTASASFAGGGGAAVGISTAGNTQGTSGNFSNGTYIFEGSNGLSVSQLTAATPGVQTLRLVAPSQTVQPVAASASNGSFNFSTLGFVQGSGVTWATQAGGIQASVKTDYQSSNANYLTSQSNQALSGSNGSFTFQTATFGSSNGIHFYTTNNSMVGSYAHSGPTGVFVNASASTLTNGNLVFSNSNNVTFGINGSTITANAAMRVSASNGSYSDSHVKFVEGSGVTWATQANGVQASVKTDYIAALAVAGSTAPGLSTIYFSNGNVTFGMNGSVITASANAGAVNQTGPNIAAGAQTVTNGTVIFSNSNGVSFGLGAGANSTQMTASVAKPIAYWAVPPYAAQSQVILTFAYLTLTAMTQRPIFLPFEVNGDMTATGPLQLRIIMSRSTNAQSNSFTVQNAIYSQVNATSMALVGSTQIGFGQSDTASISGVKLFQMPLAMTSLSAGQYYLGLMFSANGGSTSAINYLPMGAGTVAPAVGSIVFTGTNSYGLTSNAAPYRFWGRLSATAQMPANVVTADLSSAYAGGSLIPMLFTIGNLSG